MAIQVRKGVPIAYALVPQFNLLRQSVAVGQSMFHIDVTSLPSKGDFTAPVVGAVLTSTIAVASSLATSIALANDLKAKFNTHMADSVAHKAADTTNGPIATANATDLASVQTLANAIKTKINAHFTQSGVHVTNDGTNTVATANATDQTTSNALLNALQTAYNAHIQSAPLGAALSLVGP